MRTTKVRLGSLSSQEIAGSARTPPHLDRVLLSGTGEAALNVGGQSGISAGHEVPVDIERRADVAVPETHLKRFRIRP